MLLIKHLKKHGCVFEREGGNHSMWLNQAKNLKSPVPRHNEIPYRTVVNICRQLDIDVITSGR